MKTKVNLFDLTRETKEVNEYTGTKETGKVIKKHLADRFPFCKFSVSSHYYGQLSVYVVSGPFDKDSEHLEAIKNYMCSYVKSYEKVTVNDPYGDYGDHYNFYYNVGIYYDYKKTEYPGIDEIIEQFNADKKIFEQAEREREEKEFQEKLIQYEIERKQREIEEIKYKKQQAIERAAILADVEVRKIAEYTVKDVKFARLNKNQTIERYFEEVQSGEYYLNDVKVKKELHFNDIKAFEYFCNNLLSSFEFLAGEGGSETDDPRINDYQDFLNMSREEQKSVIWWTVGIGVYYRGIYQFIIDPQGHDYARYCGIGGTLPGKEHKILIPDINFNFSMN